MTEENAVNENVVNETNPVETLVNEGGIDPAPAIAAENQLAAASESPVDPAPAKEPLERVAFLRVYKSSVDGTFLVSIGESVNQGESLGAATTAELGQKIAESIETALAA